MVVVVWFNVMKVYPDDSSSPVKQSTGDSSFVNVVACFCPCYVLGASESLYTKEKGCISNEMGARGCRTCVYTSFMCGLCWPVSPLLGCYVHHMDTSLKARYGYFVPQDTWYTWFSGICCWQSTVVNHLTSLRHGIPYIDLIQSTVTDAGDMDAVASFPPVYLHQVHSPFMSNSDTADTAAVIIGADGVGKTELLMKLCCTRIENYDTPSFAADEVRVGIRKIPYRWASCKGGRDKQLAADVASASAFMEIWDIPKVQLSALQSIIAPVTHALLVYDTNRADTLQDLQDIFQEVCCLPVLNDVSFIVVAAKDDFLFTSTTATGVADAKAGAVDPCEDVVNEGARWAHLMGFEFLPIAAKYTVGIQELLRLLNQTREDMRSRLSGGTGPDHMS